MPMPSLLSDTHRGHRAISRLVGASAALLRVPTRWNGEVVLTRGRDTPPVEVDLEHRLHVHRAVLDDVVRAERGIRDDITQLSRSYESITQLVHGAIRLSRDDLTGLPDPAVGFRPDAVSDVLAIGLARSWAMDNARAVIHRTGLATASPMLISARRFDEFADLTAAARTLVSGLADQAGRPLDATHRDLVSAPESQRFHVMADWLIERNLRGLIGPEERAGFREELASVAHLEYSTVARVRDDTASMRTGQAHQRVDKRHHMTGQTRLAAEQTVVQMNVRVKGKQVGWRDSHPPANPNRDKVSDAAASLGVPVEQLRSFLAGTSEPSGAARPSANTGDQRQGRSAARDPRERGTGSR